MIKLELRQSWFLLLQGHCHKWTLDNGRKILRWRLGYIEGASHSRPGDLWHWDKDDPKIFAFQWRHPKAKVSLLQKVTWGICYLVKSNIELILFQRFLQSSFDLVLTCYRSDRSVSEDYRWLGLSDGFYSTGECSKSCRSWVTNDWSSISMLACLEWNRISWLSQANLQ